jgi:hypothetical protein
VRIGPAHPSNPRRHSVGRATPRAADIRTYRAPARARRRSTPACRRSRSATAAGRRLEPRRRQRPRLQLASPAPHPKFHRAQTDDDAVLAFQLLPDHDRIPGAPEEPLPEPVLQPVEHRTPLRLAERRRATQAHPEHINAIEMTSSRKSLPRVQGQAFATHYIKLRKLRRRMSPDEISARISSITFV